MPWTPCCFPAGELSPAGRRPGFSIDTQDSVTFVLNLRLTMIDAGSYRVCFNDATGSGFEAIPSTTGQRHITVRQPEGTSPRGVFRGQRFTALAGSTTGINVTGHRLLAPTDSKILLNAKQGATTSCGSNAEFAFSPRPLADSEAPMLVTAASLPSSSYEFDNAIHWEALGAAGRSHNSGASTLMLTFNEVVQAGANAAGTADGIHICNKQSPPSGDSCLVDDTTYGDQVTDAGGNKFKYTTAGNDDKGHMIFDGNRVFLRTESVIPAGEYILGGADDVIQDASGNKFELRTTTVAGDAISYDTRGMFEFTIVADGDDLQSPVALAVLPHDEGVDFVFSEKVSLQGSPGVAITVEDCGADLECGTADDGITSSFSTASIATKVLASQCGTTPCDQIIAFPTSGTGVHPGVATANTAMLDPGRRYMFHIPAGYVKDVNNNLNTASSLEYAPGISCGKAEGAALLSSLTIFNSAAIGTDTHWEIAELQFYVCDMMVPAAFLTLKDVQCTPAMGGDCATATQSNMIDGDLTTNWNPTTSVNNAARSTSITVEFRTALPITKIEVIHEDDARASDIIVEAVQKGATAAEEAVTPARTDIDPTDGRGFVFHVDSKATNDFRTTPEVVFMADRAEGVRDAVGTSSSATGTIFDISFDDDGLIAANGNSYAVCHCDPQKDTTLEDLGPHVHTFRLMDFTRTRSTMEHIRSDEPVLDEATSSTPADFGGLMPEWARHNCKRKCGAGCVGPDCFCDGWAGDDTEDTWLCLPPGLCREACEAHTPGDLTWSRLNAESAPTAACTGFDGNCGRALKHARCGGMEVHGTLNRCVLLREEPDAGTTCEAAGEAAAIKFLKIAFDTQAGGDSATLEEVVLKECDAMLAGLKVVSLQEVIGDTRVDLSADLTSADSTANPTRKMFDDPAGAATNSYDVSSDPAVAAGDSIEVVIELPTPARVTEVKFWSGNIDHITISGAERNVPSAFGSSVTFSNIAGAATLQWHAHRSPITVEDQNWAHFDVERGASCTHAADFNVPVGILSVTDRARIMVDYIFEVDKEGSIEVTNFNDEDLANQHGVTGHRITIVDCSGSCGASLPTKHVSVPAQATEIATWNALAPMNTLINGVPQDLTGFEQRDHGFSWQEILRYTAIKFSSAGTFKVCFCENDRTADDTCTTAADYAVEVGKVHVSGVSCLLQDKRFRKGVCCRQYWPSPAVSNGRMGIDGTYRCYRTLGSCPELTIPTMPAAPVTPPPTPAPAQPATEFDTWCLFGPEEITQLEPNCQLVAGFQSVGR
mmetsp:Transcript_75653/g.202265  ORF Transcript_75653/g.202265 Transcript_75653/m.202265 type:complete len:1281 (-) Transcript_75653:28-3870(-)